MALDVYFPENIAHILDSVLHSVNAKFITELATKLREKEITQNEFDARLSAYNMGHRDAVASVYNAFGIVVAIDDVY